MSSPARAKPVSVTLDDERVVPGLTNAGTLSHHIARYRFALQFLSEHDSILDAGCGVGYGSQMLAGRTDCVTGVDYSPLAVQHARLHHTARNSVFAQMDCQFLAFADASFDTVVSFEVFEHLPKPEQFIAECVRVLRPGGKLIISTPNEVASDIHMRSVGLHNDFHVSTMTLDQFRQLLRKHFATVAMYGQRRRGSKLYSVLRSMDVFNLRLRLLKHDRREKMQQSMGVAVGNDVSPDDWVFETRQLRQANCFIAVCHQPR